LNGEYYGILNVRDRIDTYYLASRYNLLTRKVDLLENKNAAKNGTDEHWQKVLDLIRETDPEHNGFLAEIERLIDVKSFIDYYIANIYIANTDWPSNNTAWWRYRGASGEDTGINGNVRTRSAWEDGRWRWLMYDTDTAFRLEGDKGVGFNALVFATEEGNTSWPNPDWATFMLRTLLKNGEFQQRFIARFSDLMNTAFEPARAEQ